MPDRFVHIIEASATGTLSMAAMLAGKQAGGGARVLVIYSEREETPKNISEMFGESVQLIKVDMSSLKGKLISFFIVRKLLKSFGVSVVILHSSFAGFIGRISSLLIGSEFRLFYIPHCISFMRKDAGQFKKTIFLFLEWVAALKRCTYLACSESERKIIQAYIPFRECRLVENAVEMPPVVSVETSKRAKTVMTVGGIRPQKGPREYAEIARAFSTIMPDVEFVWIGDGDPELKKVLVDAGVRVTGWLERSEVCEQLRLAGVYVSTAHWEGMPVSVIEAMYSQLPVVASRCAGNVDVVKHEDNGWLFDLPAEACERIENLFRDPGLAEQTAKRAYADACTRFTPERYFQTMSDIMQPSTL